ncbi:hypothetical protein J6590_025613 [Homalodisca vitripennis]|nr:hypothetical protein J6590_025613 [Homalodisca vitripennis]
MDKSAKAIRRYKWHKSSLRRFDPTPVVSFILEMVGGRRPLAFLLYFWTGGMEDVVGNSAACPGPRTRNSLTQIVFSQQVSFIQSRDGRSVSVDSAADCLHSSRCLINGRLQLDPEPSIWYIRRRYITSGQPWRGQRLRSARSDSDGGEILSHMWSEGYQLTPTSRPGPA